VVVTAVGDLPRVIGPIPGPGTGHPDGEVAGRVVPPQQPGALARAITELLDDPKEIQKIGAVAQRRARSQYSAGGWMDRLAALYDELLNGKPRRL
jgi:glycosyltransferase involved in cell wall biosynthesis